jgi:hypothetical protein
LLLRWQAPSPAPLTPSTTSPGPTRGTSTGPPNPRQRPAKTPPKLRLGWRTGPRLRHRFQHRPEPLRGASRQQKPLATGPPWGRGCDRCRMERSQFPRTYGEPPPCVRRSITTMPESRHKRNVTAGTDGSSHIACSACDGPSVTHLGRPAVTNRWLPHDAWIAVTNRCAPPP